MGNKGSFKKGHIPHNAGKKLSEYASKESIDKIKATQFKKGQLVGEKSNSWNGGIQTPKNDCVHVYDGPNKRKRRPRDVYEKAYGPIPKGFVIYHLDDDKNNDEPENLEAIPRKELLRRNRLKNK